MRPPCGSDRVAERLAGERWAPGGDSDRQNATAAQGRNIRSTGHDGRRTNETRVVRGQRSRRRYEIRRRWGQATRRSRRSRRSRRDRSMAGRQLAPDAGEAARPRQSGATAGVPGSARQRGTRGRAFDHAVHRPMTWMLVRPERRATPTRRGPGDRTDAVGRYARCFIPQTSRTRNRSVGGCGSSRGARRVRDYRDSDYVRCRVRSARCQVRGVRCRLRSARYQVRGARCQMRGVRCQVRGAGCQTAHQERRPTNYTKHQGPRKYKVPSPKA